MIYICLYSFGKDGFLPECIKSIINSNIDKYFVDLYVFDKQKKGINKYKFLPNMGVTFLHKAKSYSWVTNTSLNKAIKDGAKYFLLLNTDTILHPECIFNLVKFFSLSENIGIVGGYQTEYFGDWNTSNSWTKSNLQIHNIKLFEIDNHKFTLYKTYYTQGACMMFKLDLIKEIGNFNERFKLFYEETEFCRRAINRGYIVGVLKEAKIKHYSGGTWKRSILLNINRDLYYLSNQIIFESTTDCAGYISLLKRIVYIIRKQIKNIHRREDDIKIYVLFYPFVLLFVLFRIDLLFSLHKDQKSKK